MTAAALAQTTTTWSGTVSSSWGDPGNWTNGVPIATRHANIPASTPFPPSTNGAAGATCLNLTVTSGATLNLAAGFPLDVNGIVNVTSSSTVTGPGLLRAVGTGTITGGTLGNVEIAGTYTLNAMTVTGDLTQAAGVTTTIAVVAVTVNGSATFQGVTLQGSGGGTLNVRGTLTWATTGLVNLTSSVAIRCGGDWSSNGNFQPATGVVTFDGTSAQVVSGGPLHWFDMTVNNLAGVQIGASGTATVARNLTVGGGRTLSSGTLSLLQINGNCTISGILTLLGARLSVVGTCNLTSGGTTTLGANQTHTFGGDLTVITHTLQAGTNSVAELQGVGTVTSLTGGTLPNVTVTGNYSFAGNTINGNLLVQAPTVTFAGSTLVNGNAQFVGGTVVGGASGTGLLNVRGDLDWSTTGLVTFPVTMAVRCGGDWVNNANFQPANGTVTYDGSAPQVISGGPLRWMNLRVEGANVQIATTGSALVAGTFIQGTNSTFTATSLAELHVVGTCTTSSVVSLPNTALRVDGACSFGNFSTTTLGANLTHRFGGDLTAASTFTAGTNSTISLEGTGTHAFAMFSGSGQTVENLVISGRYTLSSVLIVTRDFTETPTGVITPGAFADLTVFGDSDLHGSITGVAGSQRVWSFRGNLILDTATAFTQAGGPDTIRSGGDWTSNANYQPSTGVVIFDGTGTQNVNAVNLAMRHATVGANSNLVMTVANMTVQQDLVVDGSFNTPTNSTDVAGDIVVNSGGTMTVGAGTHSVAGDLTVNGTAAGSGEIVMDGSGVLSGSGNAGNVRIDTALTITASSVDVADLELTSGALAIAANATLQVLGDADFAGGSINSGTGGVIDIDGSARFVGVTATAPKPLLRVGGDWTADSAFLPGTVHFDTPGQHRVRSEPGGSGVRFAEVQLQGGTMRNGGAGSIEITTLQIFAGATFELPAGSLTLSAVAITVAGELRLLAGADVRVGNGTSVTIANGGLWSLLGEPGNRCVVRGTPAARWHGAVQGTIAAREFELRDLSDFRGPGIRGGIVFAAGTQFAAAPYDFSDGVLAGAGTNPTGALLLLQNGQSHDFYGLAFVDTGSQPFKNAATAAAAPIAYRFFQYGGNMAGPAFEDDPNGIIAWQSQGRTTLASATATSGLQRIDIAFATTMEVDTTQFQIWRKTSPTGAAALVAALSATGTPASGAAYAWTDLPLTTTARTWYEIHEAQPGRPTRRLAEVSARAWQPQSGNAFFVGPGGFADIQAALAVAPDGATILVGGGTYPPFQLNRPMRILPHGSGPVLIDTTVAPLVVRDITAARGDVTLYDLEVGSPTSAFGMQIVNCDNVIVLDQVAARSQAIGLVVDDCPRVALQSVECRGTPALRVSNGSMAFVSRGDVTTLQVVAFSHVRHAGLTLGSGSSDATSTLTAVPMVPPRLDFPLALSGLQPALMGIAGEPADFYVLLGGFNRAFVDLSPLLPVEMVALVDPAASFPVGSGILGANGTAELPLMAPDSPDTWGGALSMQIVVIRSTAIRPFLIGNVRDAFFVP